MNERIKQLVKQAKDHADYYAMLSDGMEQEIFTEKFAELIIVECATLVDAAFDIDEHSGEVVSYADGTQLKEHFGVDAVSIKVGSRIKVISGFNVSAKGTVKYIEPSGRLWVLRDGASSDVFYHADEVVGVEQ